jgi:hypothetical protein
LLTATCEPPLCVSVQNATPPELCVYKLNVMSTLVLIGVPSGASNTPCRFRVRVVTTAANAGEKNAEASKEKAAPRNAPRRTLLERITRWHPARKSFRVSADVEPKTYRMKLLDCLRNIHRHCGGEG